MNLKNQHPLINRTGISQRTRINTLLSETSTLVDGKTLSDRLYIIGQYAKQINYYEYIKEGDLEYQQLDNWSSFFEKSLAFQLVTVNRVNINELSKKFDEASQEGLADTFYMLFDTMVNPLTEIYRNTKDQNIGINVLLNDARGPLQDILQLYQTAVKNNLSIAILGENITSYAQFPWGLDIMKLVSYKVKNEKGKPIQETDIKPNLKEHFNTLLAVFSKIVNTATNYVPEAIYPLEEAYQQNQEPHIALLFAFLELFKYFEGNLNDLGQKHLDFFYKKVLRMVPKEAVPDKAHIVFEIAKHLDDYKLPKDLLLKDGKDANKQDIIFGLDNELIIDKAQVKELRTLSVNKNSDKAKTIEGVYIAPVANSADGLGAKFAKEQTPNWPTLGRKESKLLIEERNDKNEVTGTKLKKYPKARLGFAFASPVLFLQEGNRKITIELKFDQSIRNFNDYEKQIKEGLKIQFSGEEGWLSIPSNIEKTLDIKHDSSTNTLTITIELEPDFPSIVFYNEKVLQEELNLKQNFPVVKIEIDSDEEKLEVSSSPNGKCPLENTGTSTNKFSVYDLFKSLKLQNVKIDVTVCGVKNLIVQNDENLQDVNKPILPFGPRPKVGEGANHKGGASFYIGSKEIFLKNWETFKINTTWRDKPVNMREHYEFYNENNPIQNESFKFITSFLNDGEWKNDYKETKQTPPKKLETINERNLFESTGNIVSSCKRNLENPSFEYYFKKNNTNVEYVSKSMSIGELAPLNVNTRNGFVKLTLIGSDFQHELYTFILARQMQRLAGIVDVFSIDNVRKSTKKFQRLSSLVEYRANNINSSINDVKEKIEAFAVKLNSRKNTILSIVGDINSNIDNHVSSLQDNLASINDKLTNKVLKGLSDATKELQDGHADSDIEVGELKRIVQSSITTLNTVISNETNRRSNSISLYIKRITDNLTSFSDNLKDNTGASKIQKIVNELNNILEFEHNNTTFNFNDIVSDLQTLKNSLNGRSRGTIPDPIYDAYNDPENGGYQVFDSYSLVEISKNLKRLSDEISGGADKASTFGIPKEPYTPKISNLSVDYTATSDNKDIDLIHLHPYEKTSKFIDIENLNATATKPLFPYFNDEGTLFIGIENLKLGGIVSLLFQFAEATANSEEGNAKIRWHYLKDNTWNELASGKDIISDDTGNLTTSGIIRIAVPSDISNEKTTILPNHLHWFKVSATDNAIAVPEALGIYTQAVKTSARLSKLNDQTRLNKALPANSVNKLSAADFSIKKVQQFFPSFGGKLAEAEGSFYVRVSEHLKHKGRAQTIEDYEKIVLEAFPEIYKVKCISHTLGLSAVKYKKDLEIAPGHVVVTVIPDLTKLLGGNALNPKAPLSLLEKIETHLRERISPFARIKVMNPRYEPVNIDVKVVFKIGKSEGFYKLQLEKDLTKFLAPWYLGDNEKLSFGMPVLFSDIVGFVEQLDYIDIVSSLKLTHAIDNTSQKESKKYDRINPLTARSILTAGKIDVSYEGKCVTNE